MGRQTRKRRQRAYKGYALTIPAKKKSILGIKIMAQIMGGLLSIAGMIVFVIAMLAM